MEATIAQIDDHRPMPKVNPSLWVSYGRSRFDTSWIINNKDGYHWIKVAEPDTWRQKHHLIWEEANGQKVPEGCIIRFADGDKENFSPNNLICVSRSVNLEMNRRGYDPAGSTELGKVQATTATLEVLRRKKKNGSE